MAATSWGASPADHGARHSGGATTAARATGTAATWTSTAETPATPDRLAALREDLALGLRASYRHLATLHLAAGSHARAAAMLSAAEKLGGPL